MSDKIALFVLAAGESKRLGKPKQLLEHNNETLLDSVLGEMEEVEDVKRYLVLGYEKDEILEKVNTFSWNIIYNADWRMGIGKSISVAIKSLTEEYSHALFVLGDQYRLKGSEIDDIIRAISDTKIIISRNIEAYSPPVLWPRIYFEELAKLSDDNGAKGIIHSNEDNIKPIILPSSRYDVDTETDVRNWKKWLLFRDTFK